MLGACAGMCYNALWYFPVLIVLGGVVTASWDVLLRRQVLRLRKRLQERRRPLDRNTEIADNQDARVLSPDLSVPPQAAFASLQRRTGSAVTPLIETSQSEPPARSELPIRGDTFTDDESTSNSTDMRSHGIPVWAGLGIIAVFFGRSTSSFLELQSITCRSLVHHCSSNSCGFGRAGFGLQFIREYVPSRHNYLWRGTSGNTIAPRICSPARVGVFQRFSYWSCDNSGIPRAKLQFQRLPWRTHGSENKPTYNPRCIHKLRRYFLTRLNARRGCSGSLESSSNKASFCQLAPRNQCHRSGTGVHRSISIVANRILDS